MPVFLAASDETSGGNALTPFHYSGWIAPETDWSRFFAPAWQERVLDGPPKIPFLHMIDIRSRAWRDSYGITEADADERLDDAAIVIDQLGSMYPLFLTIDMSIFKPLYREHTMVVASGGAKAFQPDFLAFVAYAYGVLKYVHDKHPGAERVDFLVENNSEITKHIHELYADMPNALRHVGGEYLIPLVGKFVPGGKDRVPLQAADYLCWHSRRAHSNALHDLRDLRRFNTIANRQGFKFDFPAELLKGLSDSFYEHGKTRAQINGSRNPHRTKPDPMNVHEEPKPEWKAKK